MDFSKTVHPPKLQWCQTGGHNFVLIWEEVYDIHFATQKKKHYEYCSRKAIKSMQQLTFPKFLILAIATYLTVTGKTCEWFRNVRHGIRHRIHERSSQGGFHLRRSHQHSFQITHQDSVVTNSKDASFELLNDIVNAPPLEKHEESMKLDELLAEVTATDETVASK